MAVFASYIAPQDPIATSWGAIRKAPSAAHWFGTDEIGRDVLSRVIWGTQASLMAGVISVSISLLIGVPIGLQKLGRDPAMGSSVLLTFTTDSMGFFIFLGLASLFFS